MNEVKTAYGIAMPKGRTDSILVKNKIFLMQNGFNSFASVPDPVNGYFVSGLGYMQRKHCSECNADREHIYGYLRQELRRREVFKAESMDQLLRGCNYVKCRHCAAVEHKKALDGYVQKKKSENPSAFEEKKKRGGRS